MRASEVEGAPLRGAAEEGEGEGEEQLWPFPLHTVSEMEVAYREASGEGERGG